MKTYTFPLILFLATFGIGTGIYKLLEPSLSHDLLGILFRIFLGVFFIIFTINFVKNNKTLFKFSKITKEQIGLTILLSSLFAVNNYFHAEYNTRVEYMSNSNIYLVLVGFIVNSIFEEFTYRGFIQGYVNQNFTTLKSPISKGNIFASTLMLITHFGFFWAMDLIFAITGLILVLLFSLTAGYIRDKGGSIWFLIILHTFINGIHVLMNLEHYL